MTKKHHVALIRIVGGGYCDYCGGSEDVLKDISEWVEITEEEFEALQWGRRYGKLGGWQIVEQPVNQQEVVQQTVRSVLDHIEAEKQKIAKRDAKKKATAEKSKKARALKLIEKAEKLKAELDLE